MPIPMLSIDQTISHPARDTPSQMVLFARYCEAFEAARLPAYADLHRFSVEHYRQFWRLFLQWSQLEVQGNKDVVCTSDVVHEAIFFPSARLNFTQSLLSSKLVSDSAPALLGLGWNGSTERLTRGELKERVAAAAAALLRLGFDDKKRAAFIASSDVNCVVSVLACAAVGIPMALAGPEVASEATIARLRAVAPQILFCHARAPYETECGAQWSKIDHIIQALPSVLAVVFLDSTPPPAGVSLPHHTITDLVAGAIDEPFHWPQLGFNHPLYILFTSGTTGDPKALVHGAGGTLLEQVKEHRLHCDLQPGDRMLFFSSTAWMMWPWGLTALASGTEIVVYDGAVVAPETLWTLVSSMQITVFGTSPAYLQLSERINGDVLEKLDFSKLRAVMSTGSILYPQQQEWFSRHIKELPIQSISGGTDLFGCFVMGNPDLPGYAGEPQCKGLGFDLRSLPVESASHPGIGELVCAKPFPSRPIGLLNDAEGKRFYDSYFAQHPGYWTQGDLVEFTQEGRIRMHGRSDGILNIRGVRIGPADIYHVLKDFAEVDEAMAVEQRVPADLGHARIVLLVVLKPPHGMTEELKSRMTRAIATRTSASHVPSVIAQVAALPTTHTGKRSERSARDAVNGNNLTSHAGLRNPECLAEIASHPAIALTLQSDAAPASGTAALHRVPSEDWLTELWESMLNIRPIDRHDDFFDIGGNSTIALAMLRALDEFTGTELPLTMMYEARTIARMAELLGDSKGLPTSDLVLVKPGVGKQPLYLVHGLGGDVMELFTLGRMILHDGPVYAIRARGLDGKTSPLHSIQEMAETYLRAVREIQPSGPYLICGHSFGGLIAYEMSTLLERQSGDVAMLVMLDTTVGERYWPLPVWLKVMALRAGKTVTSLGRLSIKSWPSYFIDRLGAMRQRIQLRGTILGSIGSTPSDTANHRPDHITQVRQAALRAMSLYLPRAPVNSMLLIRAQHRNPPLYDALPLWKSLAKNFRCHVVPCDHFSLIAQPYVQEVAASISQVLTEFRPA